MQMRSACSAIAQCGSGGALALPSPFRPSSQATTTPTMQVSIPTARCSRNSSPSLRKVRTAKDAATDFSSAGAASIAGIGAVGGRNSFVGREGIERTTATSSCRAAVQESGLSTTVAEKPSAAAPTENGSAILTADRSSSPDLQRNSSDYIGFGCILEGGSFFRERFVIRFSEAGHRGTVSLEILSSLLQEAATNHVIAMDYAFTPGKNLDGNITVVTRMHIEVDRYPAWRDLLEVDTWFQREGKNAVRRDWIVKDVKTGKKIAFATSTWVLMNSQTRRLAKLREEHWAELEPHMRHPPRGALSEDRREVSTKKITKLGDDATYKKSGLIACANKDTDMNQHVNNIRYISWMLESMPEDVKSAYEVSKITLEYRQEVSPGQPVDSLAETEESESSSERQFIHLISTSEVGKEVNRGRTVWRPLQ
ncbi:unnamed protein product [Calypogeia fissa]